MSGKVNDSLTKLEAALKRLGEALAEDSSNPLFIDGTIQRFEFVFLSRAFNLSAIDSREAPTYAMITPANQFIRLNCPAA